MARTVELKLGDATLILRRSVANMAAVERRFGSLDFAALFTDASLNFETRSSRLVGLVYDLAGGGPRPTPEALGDLIDIADFPAITEAITNLMGGDRAAGDPRSLAPFVPSPEPLIQAMLDAAGLAPGEILLDPCCGDGRVLAAAMARGAIAVGHEIDPGRAELSRKTGATVHETDGATADFGAADVIFLYTLPDSNRKLQPLLLAQCKPFCRVVSHAFDMPGWNAYASGTVSGARWFAWKIADVRAVDHAAAA